MTDVVFANQNRMVSVLVNPISNIRDHPVAVILRYRACGFSSSPVMFRFWLGL